MPKNYLKLFLLPATCLFIATSTSQIFAQETQLSFKTHKISDSLYMLSGVGGFTGGNVGVSVGEDGVAMIDNGISDVLEILRAEVAEITDKPIDYMINTHVHGDHIGNNVAYGKDGAKIISHENLRRSLAAKKDKQGNAQPKESLPVLTFNDRMTLHINGDTAKIIHFDNAHTDGDAVVYFEKDNVLHTGDILFNGNFPFIDGNNGGTLDGVIRALSSITELVNDKTKIIPGHGPLATRADVQKTVAMLNDAKTLVSDLVSKGKTDEEILSANPLAKYKNYASNFITVERMTKQVLANVRS